MTDNNADKISTWEILGEDPNCDLGGAHYQPKLGIYQGKYEDIVSHALGMSAFISWGSGGDIKEVKIQTVDERSKKIAELNKELDKYDAKRKEILNKLQNI